MRRTLSVRLSVCLSVRPVMIITERHVARRATWRITMTHAQKAA